MISAQYPQATLSYIGVVIAIATFVGTQFVSIHSSDLSFPIQKEYFKLGIAALVPFLISAILDSLDPSYSLTGKNNHHLIFHFILLGSFNAPIVSFLVMEREANAQLQEFFSTISVVFVSGMLSFGSHDGKLKQGSTQYSLMAKCLSPGAHIALMLFWSLISQLLSVAKRSAHSADFLDTFAYVLKWLVCIQSIVVIFSCMRDFRQQGQERLSAHQVCNVWQLLLLVLRNLTECLIISTSGSIRSMSLSMPLFYLQTAFIMAILTVPEKRFITLTLRALIQCVEEKVSFTRYISHELRTPLNIIHLSLGFISAEAAKLAKLFGAATMEPIEGAITDVSESCTTAIGILDELLTMDKMQSNKLVVELELIDPVNFLRTSVRQFQILAHQNCVDFEMFADLNDSNTHRLRVNIDAQKIGQVIRNLLSNAFKFTPEGGRVTVRLGTIYLQPCNSSNKSGGIGNDSSAVVVPLADVNQHDRRIDEDSRDRGDVTDGMHNFLEVRVIDNGAGISVENQKKLFRQYMQVNASILQKGKGSGLGLWISRGLVEMHGGFLTATSEGEGHGSTFILRLPLQRYTGLVSPIVSTPNRSQVQRRSFSDGSDGSFLSHSGFMEVRQCSEASLRSSCTRSSMSRILQSRDDVTHAAIISTSAGHKNNFSIGFPDSGPQPQSQQILECGKSSHCEFDGLAGTSTPFKPAIVALDVAEEQHRLGSVSHSLDVCNGAEYAESTDQHRVRPIEMPHTLNFLVVDDSRPSRRAVSRLLQGAGHSVTEASSGIEALNILGACGNLLLHQFQVILMDNCMPGMSGIETSQRVRELGSDALIIGLTGDVFDEEVKGFIASGANEVMAKPLHVATLTAIVHTWFSSRECTMDSTEVHSAETSTKHFRGLSESARSTMHNTFPPPSNVPSKPTIINPAPEIEASSLLGVLNAVGADWTSEGQVSTASEWEGVNVLVAMYAGDAAKAVTTALFSQGHRVTTATTFEDVLDLIIAPSRGGGGMLGTSVDNGMDDTIHVVASMNNLACSLGASAISFCGLSVSRKASVQCRPDVLLLDHDLLQSSGLYLPPLVEMRNSGFDGRIVLLVRECDIRTAYGDLEVASRVRGAEFTLLVKPVQAAQLKDIIAEMNVHAI